ncbi:hypothetical protein [Streptomyces sp. NPDC096323]|uniref:hypothetical protein n=1 Tax=Streptomyces sp. NPDC096323 TaxID=3155822 RepID=UPI003333D70D
MGHANKRWYIRLRKPGRPCCCSPAAAAAKEAVADQEAKGFAAMFAERAQQAQNGEKPSAAVAGG